MKKILLTQTFVLIFSTILIAQDHDLKKFLTYELPKKGIEVTKSSRKADVTGQSLVEKLQSGYFFEIDDISLNMSGSVNDSDSDFLAELRKHYEYMFNMAEHNYQITDVIKGVNSNYIIGYYSYKKDPKLQFAWFSVTNTSHTKGVTGTMECPIANAEQSKAFLEKFLKTLKFK